MGVLRVNQVTGMYRVYGLGGSEGLEFGFGALRASGSGFRGFLAGYIGVHLCGWPNIYLLT